MNSYLLRKILPNRQCWTQFNQARKSYSTTQATVCETKPPSGGGPPNWYFACGVPVGMYTSYQMYDDMIGESYHPSMSNRIMCSTVSGLMGLCMVLIWPVAVPGIIHGIIKKK